MSSLHDTAFFDGTQDDFPDKDSLRLPSPFFDKKYQFFMSNLHSVKNFSHLQVAVSGHNVIIIVHFTHRVSRHDILGGRYGYSFAGPKL
jgi:hypothetical protein